MIKFFRKIRWYDIDGTLTDSIGIHQKAFIVTLFDLESKKLIQILNSISLYSSKYN